MPSAAPVPGPSQERSSQGFRSVSSSAAADRKGHTHQQHAEALNASDLVQAHRGDTEQALNAAVAAHNSITGAEAEKARLNAENSKLWTWCSSLKKERDGLFKDRVKLERKVADLLAFCRAQGLQPPEEIEEPAALSTLGSSSSRPAGPPRSRSGEVLLRENHSSRDRGTSGRTSAPSRSKTDSEAPPNREAAKLRSQIGAQPGSSTSPDPTSNQRSPSGHGLRRKASSVDLGNPASSTSPKQHHQQPDTLYPEDSTPSRPAPKYTLNGLEISQSPFAPAFPPTGRRVSSIATSPTHPRHGPNSLEDFSSPAMGGQRVTRSPSDSLAATERSKVGLGIQQASSSQDVQTPRAGPSQKSQSLPPTEQTEDAVEDVEEGISLHQILQEGGEGGEPVTLTPSSSLSSTGMLASPEKDRHGVRHASSASPSHGQEAPRPPLKATYSNDSQVSSSDWQRATSAPSPVSGVHPSEQTPATRTTTTLNNFRLDPGSLQNCKIRVNSSQIKTNDRAREVILFFITISLPLSAAVSPNQEKATAHWTVEKYYSDVLQLDTTVKSKHGRSVTRKIANVPDKSLFKDHAPSKVDLRKAVLQKYLRSLVAAELDITDDVCQFLTTNVVDERNTPVTNPAYKAGYLTKKGRLIGGWQTRYYALQGPFLEYYESQGGPHLGHIDVTGAQIGRQQTSKDLSSNDTYRHAFLIRENRKARATDTGTDVDHILCAESDSDRDEWVRVLAAWATGEYVQPPETFLPTSESNTALQSQEMTPTASTASSAHHHHQQQQSHPPPQVRKGSRDDGPKPFVQPPSAAFQPTEAHMQKFFQNPFGATQDRQNAAPAPRHHREDSAGRTSLHSDSSQPAEVEPPLQQRILRKRNDHTATDLPASASLPAGLDSIANARPSSQQSHHNDPAPQSQSSSQRPASPSKLAAGKISGPMNGAPITASNFKVGRAERQNKVKSSFWGFARGDKHPPVVAVQRQPVFGVPLEDAVNRCRVRDGFELPAVVFRCVEYLQAKSAVKEEGLYRLSGSSTVIKGLKEKFDTEGDVNLLASGQYHDPHAVAGLLKLFLRELPVSVLTRELQPYFLRVVDLAQRRDKVNELGSLVAQLPVANYTLLRFLSSHLTHVIQNEPINKMSLRNIGIVFSPTLAIPATLFNLFLTEFELVFRTLDDQPAPVMLEEEEADQSGPSRAVSADMSVETITDAHQGRRKSRNSQYYSQSGADLLLEPDAGRLNESDERDAEEEDAAAADSEQESTTSQYRSPLPSPTLAQGTAPSSVESDLETREPLPVHNRSKAKALFVNTASSAPTSGLPASPGSKFLSSPRHLTARPPLSPH